MKIVTISNIPARVGQNAQENWNLLEKAEEEYWFFHLTSFPSCYVIWECKDDEITEEELEELAILCVANTKYKNAKYMKVDCTRCSNLEKGDVVGEVIYISKRKVRVIKI